MSAGAEFLWMNGRIVRHDEAVVHFLTPALHYGAGVFEGIRCYDTSSGPAVFRLRDSAGQIRVKLGAGGDGSGLLLLDGQTEPAIHMLAKTGGTSVTLTSKGGQRRIITP